MSILKDKKIIVGVTGSIAAYKSCELVRNLIKKEAEIQVVMTKNAFEIYYTSYPTDTFRQKSC